MQQSTTEGTQETTTDEGSSNTQPTNTFSSFAPAAAFIPALAAPSIANYVSPTPATVPISTPAPQPTTPNSNFAGTNQVSMDSQIAKITSSIDSIQVPPPLSPKDVSLSWEEISLSKDHSEAMLQVGDLSLLAWDMAGKIGSKINFPCKVLMIAGKTFIAGEDGAYVSLIEKDKAYDDALQYLKNPATSKRFAELVRDMKEGRFYFSFDSRMVRAAKAVNDPKNGSGGMELAWDSMLSPQAKAAMARKACMEIGAELVSTGTEGLVKELTERKELFEAARIDRKQAQSLLKQATDPSEKAQLMNAIEKTENIMENTYKIQEAGPKALGAIEGIYLSGEAEKSQEK